MMTKKDYDNLSAIIAIARKNNPTPAARAALDEVIEQLCELELERNPTFKAPRFMADAEYLR